jgi:1-acyl-sn-glycerol-3-phosphate acyltransferase
MAVVKTFFVFFVTVFILIVVTLPGCLAFGLSFFGLKKPMAFVVYKIAWVWARILIALSGCAITVEGRANIPRKGGVCFVANHGSIFDIILALAYIGRPFGFIAKKELLLVPFINMWIFVLGGLFIDRSHPRKALKTISKGAQRLKSGGGVLIFPEGHRSKGEGLLPFHPGSFKLATQAGVPIVPMAITGSYDVFEKYGRVNVCPVRLVFCKPVNTEEVPHEERKLLAGRVREIIEQALLPKNQGGGSNGERLAGNHQTAQIDQGI